MCMPNIWNYFPIHRILYEIMFYAVWYLQCNTFVGISLYCNKRMSRTTKYEKVSKNTFGKCVRSESEYSCSYLIFMQTHFCADIRGLYIHSRKKISNTTTKFAQMYLSGTKHLISHSLDPSVRVLNCFSSKSNNSSFISRQRSLNYSL
jgi:hypothetical protein